MGSSSALHLARRGYTDIRVLDMFQPPSANSAGNDINKVSAEVVSSDLLCIFGKRNAISG